MIEKTKGEKKMNETEIKEYREALEDIFPKETPEELSEQMIEKTKGEKR